MYCESQELGRKMLDADFNNTVFSTDEEIESCPVRVSVEYMPQGNALDEQVLPKLAWLLAAHTRFPVPQTSSYGSEGQLLLAIKKFLELSRSKRRHSKPKRKRNSEQPKQADLALRAERNPELEYIKTIFDEGLLDEIIQSEKTFWSKKTVGKKTHEVLKAVLQPSLEKLTGQKYLTVQAHRHVDYFADQISKSLSTIVYKPNTRDISDDLLSQPVIYLSTDKGASFIVASFISQLCLLIKFKKIGAVNEETLCEFWNGLSESLRGYVLCARDSEDPTKNNKIDSDFLYLLGLQVGAYNYLSESAKRKKIRIKKAKAGEVVKPELWARTNIDQAKLFLFNLLQSAEYQTPLKPKR